MNRLQGMGMTAVLAISLSGCWDDYLTTEPQTILTDEQVWSDPNLVLGVLSNYYTRLPDHLHLEQLAAHENIWATWDEFLWSGNPAADGSNQITQYAYSTASAWNEHYALIRDIHVAIDGIEASTSPLMSAGEKSAFTAELRFMRAWVYFDLVKRMGGVPILREQLVYDFSGDPSYLQVPRDSEEEVYDFLDAELTEIAPLLGNAGDPSRANRYTALALKSRAMLYAGSLARHNNEMAAPITLPGGEVGIPASRATDYYQKSLDASREIIESGAYSLHQSDSDPGQAFYEVITLKSGNPEVIWAKDYSAAGGRTHNFTVCTVALSVAMDACGNSQPAALSPWLQLVETFDHLDGSDGAMRGVGTGSNTAAGQANWIFYDRPQDIFAEKDARLWGTVIYPGSVARGSEIQLQAGIYVWNDAAGKYDKIEGTTNSTWDDGGVLTGFDGPKEFQGNITPTGFYPRKFIDPNPAGGTATAGSDVWWVRFRLGEIYMNATEAAFELGLQNEALDYINTLRERAGHPPNSLATLSRDKIRSERWAELAFEDHRHWDLKRWRIAHEVWDGTQASETANAYSLWGYRVVHPGHPNDGTYVYDKIRATRQTRPRYFRLGNYYSEIPATVLNNNQQLVPNPFH